MRNLILAASLAAFGAATLTGAVAGGDETSETVAEITPTWAFITVAPGGGPRWSDRVGPYGVPGSSKRYTQVEVDNLKAPPDWFPAATPRPDPVMHGGGAPAAFACAACHLTSGMGVPQSSSLAGLPAPYLMRQFVDFQSGRRSHRVIVDGKPTLSILDGMVAVANSWRGTDMTATIDYFARQKPRSWVRVVESRTAPKTFQNGAYRLPAPGNEVEPLGDRIVELAVDPNRQLLRDPTLGTIAYVPVGSPDRGRRLVESGPLPCASCHGEGLRGVGDVPSIAGRSPLYVFRQLYLFKHDGRRGDYAALMRQPVRSMGERDMIDAAAYLATLRP